MSYYQQNMFSIRSRTLLANILAEVVLLNQTNECFRQALANTPYFDTIALFRLLDKEEKGYICEKDLQRAIGTTHRKLLTYAFTWIDNLKAGQVSRLEFAAFLLPKDNLQLRQLVAQRVQQPQLVAGQTLLEQFSIFREMVLEIIKREMKIIELRQELLKAPGYSIRGAVLAIDQNRHDWVCGEDLYKFMKNFGFDVTLRQVEKLVQVVNFAVDGKISEAQLKWTVQGLEGEDRSYLNKIKKANKQLPPKKPVNFQPDFERYKSAQKSSKNQQIKPAQQTYRNIVQRLKQVEVQQKTIDTTLLAESQLTLQTIKQKQQEQLKNLQTQRAMARAQKQKARALQQAQYNLHREIDTMLTKNQLLQAETQRLFRLQNRANIYEDVVDINKALALTPVYSAGTSFALSRHQRPPSFGLQDDSLGSIRASNFGRVEPSFHCRTSLAPIEINSIMRGQSIKRHVQSSNMYLQEARQIQLKIKRERQIQKNIRLQFTNGYFQDRISRIDDKRQLDYGSDNNTFEYLPYRKSKAPGLIIQKKQKNLQFGSLDIKKREFASRQQLAQHRQLGLNSHKKANSNKKQSAILIQKQLQQQFQTPQHNPYPQLGSALAKLDLSTTNKQQL